MVDWINGVEVIFIDKDLLRFINMVFYDFFSRVLFKIFVVGKVLGYDWYGIEIIFFVVYDIYSFMRKLFWYYR